MTLHQTLTPEQSDQPDLAGTDVYVSLPDDFRLQSGQRLIQSHIVARTYGPAKGPVVITAGGISAGRVLFAKDDSTEAAPGWWEGVAGPNAALDLNTWRVISVEFAPLKPAAEIYTLTTQDQARLIRIILDALSIPHVHAFIGASYGAMIALAFAEIYPDFIDRVCAISAAHRAHPMATAMRGMQRRLLQLGLETGHEREAISLARQLAMTTYRSEDEFLERFFEHPPEAAGDNYAVCTYLRSRGDAYTVSDAKRWICLSDSLDRHRIDPAKLKAKIFLAAVPNDRLVPYADMKTLSETLRNSVFIDLPSVYGHDAFLKEIPAVSDIVRRALTT